MGHPIDRAVRGLGGFHFVSIELGMAHASGAFSDKVIQDLIESMSIARGDAVRCNIMLALLCGIMNEHFMATGRLWRVADNGTIDFDFINDGPPRQAVGYMLTAN